MIEDVFHEVAVESSQLVWGVGPCSSSSLSAVGQTCQQQCTQHAVSYIGRAVSRGGVVDAIEKCSGSEEEEEEEGY